jgi:hypothetical protein
MGDFIWNFEIDSKKARVVSGKFLEALMDAFKRVFWKTQI